MILFYSLNERLYEHKYLPYSCPASSDPHLSGHYNSNIEQLIVNAPDWEEEKRSGRRLMICRGMPCFWWMSSSISEEDLDLCVTWNMKSRWIRVSSELMQGNLRIYDWVSFVCPVIVKRVAIKEFAFREARFRCVSALQLYGLQGSPICLFTETRMDNSVCLRIIFGRRKWIKLLW